MYGHRIECQVRGCMNTAVDTLRDRSRKAVEVRSVCRGCYETITRMRSQRAYRSPKPPKKGKHSRRRE